MLSLSTAGYSETGWAGSSALILIYLGWYLGVICTLSAPISADASEEWLISCFQKCKCCTCPCSRDLVDLNIRLMVTGESHILTCWILAALHFDAQGDFRVGRASKGKCLSKDTSLSSPWRKWGGGSKGAATSLLMVACWCKPVKWQTIKNNDYAFSLGYILLSSQAVCRMALDPCHLQLKSHAPSCWRISP